MQEQNHLAITVVKTVWHGSKADFGKHVPEKGDFLKHCSLSLSLSLSPWNLSQSPKYGKTIWFCKVTFLIRPSRGHTFRLPHSASVSHVHRDLSSLVHRRAFEVVEHDGGSSSRGGREVTRRRHSWVTTIGEVSFMRKEKKKDYQSWLMCTMLDAQPENLSNTWSVYECHYTQCAFASSEWKHSILGEAGSVRWFGGRRQATARDRWQNFFSVKKVWNSYKEWFDTPNKN